MKSLFGTRIFDRIFLFLFLFVVLFLAYTKESKKIPVTYWDEFIWVGRSYFFDFYFRGDFDDPVWTTTPTYDQPKLAEYLYGLWLYPFYTKEKSRSGEYSYVDFLIDNGLRDILAKSELGYLTPRQNYLMYEGSDSGFSDYYQKKYGTSGLKAYNLIFYSRGINIILLSLGVVAAFWMISHIYGKLVGFLFYLFYGFNPLLIESGLKAQSEGLFVFCLNFSLLFLTLYFYSKRNLKYLLLFGIFAGLSASTKLTGFILPLIFLLLQIIFTWKNKKLRIKNFSLGLWPFLICILILFTINPFLLEDPINNLIKMFDRRIYYAFNSLPSIIAGDFLANPLVRTTHIIQNFYISDKFAKFNGLIFIKGYGSVFKLFVTFLFLMGFKKTIEILRKEPKSLVFLLSFSVIFLFASYHLTMNWDRYYVHLVLFFITIQTVGLKSFVLRGQKAVAAIVKNLFLYIKYRTS